MKKSLFILISFILLAGCTKEQSENHNAGGEVPVTFGVKVGSQDVIIRSKSASTDPIYRLSVFNADNDMVVSIDTLSEKNNNVKLLAKTYKAVVESGKLVDKAFDAPYYVGEKEFTVSESSTNAVDMNVKLGNIKVSVEYCEQLAQYLSEADTHVKLGDADGLSFKLNDMRSGYYKPLTDANTITWSVAIFPLNGDEQNLSGKMDNLKANDHLILRFGLLEDDDETGGLRVNVVATVESVIDIDHSLELPFPRFPEIILKGADILEEQTIIASSTDPIIIDIKGFNAIHSLNMTYNMAIEGVTGSSLDIMTAGMQTPPLVLGDYAAGGVNIEYTEVGDGCDNPVRITLESDLFLSRLENTPDNGTPYEFTFSVTDVNKKKIERRLRFNKIDSDVITLTPKGVDVWATKIFMTGSWVNETAPTTLLFQYKEESESSWKDITATAGANKSFTATILKLKPSTVYHIRAKGESGANIVKVATAPSVQLYNSGLDIWSTEGSAYYARQNSSFAFWDSGNKGATTIGSNNPTEPERSDVVEGEAAAKLTSKVIANNFAAGNLFVGEFIGVNIIGGAIPEMTFGRPFASRPFSLKGHYKYNNGKINYAGGGKDHLKGLNDRFNMVVILTDGKNMPRYLNTKNTSPFDIDKIMATGSDANINAIASGVFSSEVITNGVDMSPEVRMSNYAPFEIKLKYHEANKNLEVKYIVVIFSASKYGDFFTGYEGSCLLLDALELDYNF